MLQWKRIQQTVHCVALAGLCLTWSGSASAQFLKRTVGAYSTSSAAFVPVPDGRLTFTPSDVNDVWVLLFSAKLQSSSAAENSVEVAYFVNAVEHGYGGIQNVNAPGGGSWQHFYRVTGTVLPQNVEVRLRDASGGVASILDLVLIAFKLPPNHDMRFVEQESLQSVTPGGWSSYANLSFTPLISSPHLIMAVANGRRGASASPVGIRLRDTSGNGWPIDSDGSDAGHMGNPRNAWQSFFVARVQNLGPAAEAFDLQARNLTGTSELRYVRVMAFRTDVFPFAESVQNFSETPITSTTPVTIATLNTTPSGAASDRIIIQNQVLRANASPTIERRSGFETDDVVQTGYNHRIDDPQYRTSFGRFDAVTTLSSLKLENTVSSSNVSLAVSVKESVIHVLQLPTASSFPKMYWTDPGTDRVRRADLNGTNLQTIATGGLIDPTGIAVDPINSKVYWTESSGPVIRRANLDGTNRELILGGLVDPRGMALDVAGAKMYWVNAGTGEILRANLDGTSVESVINGLSDPNDIALDVAGNKMYWTEAGLDRISSANLDGSGSVALVTALSTPRGIALDLVGGKMYWVDEGLAKIQRANLNGTSVQDIKTGLNNGRGLAVDSAAGKIYWTEVGTQQIRRANLDGSVTELLVSGLNSPTNIDLGPAAFTQENIRSIGTFAGALASSGTATIAGSSSLVTFSAPLPSKIDAGDELVLGSETFHILSRNSDTQFTVQTPAASAHTNATFTVRRAFTTLQNWEDAREGDLVANGLREIGVVYNDGPFTAGLTIDGSTTDPQHFMHLIVLPSQGHGGVAGAGAVLDGLNASSNNIRVRDDFAMIEGLELIRHRGGAGASAISVEASEVDLRRLLIHDFYDAANFVAGVASTGTFDLTNSIIYDGDDAAVTAAAAGSSRIFNCTIFGMQDGGGIRENLGTFDVVNTISMNNNGPDFDVVNGGEAYEISSDGTANGLAPLTWRTATAAASPGSGDWVIFQNLIPGAEDFHLQGSAENDAVDAGGDASSYFPDDIDYETRTLPWDIGADEGGPLAAGGPSISSGANQQFVAGQASTGAPDITVTDDPTTTTITAANDIRIRIPDGFHMRWNPATTFFSPGGTAAGLVDNFIAGYEDFGRTVVIDVLGDFNPGDTLVVSGLDFFNFTAPSPTDMLELEVGNNDLVSALDDYTVEVTAAAAGPVISTEANQLFTVGAPSTLFRTIFVSDAQFPTIDTTDIRIRVPAGFAMAWDNSVGSVSIGGSAAAKVSQNVAYEDLRRTAVLDVVTDFVAGDYISVTGLAVDNFTAVSGPDNLELEIHNNSAVADTDDKTIEINNVTEVPFFTARATSGRVRLEWVNPVAGSCLEVLIYARNDGVPPTSPGDALARFLTSSNPCTAGTRHFVEDSSLFNGQAYGYTAFVNHIAGTTPGKKLVVRPIDTSGQVKWAYTTGATSMAAPGLRFSGGSASYVYAVSNDHVVHSMNGGNAAAGGGEWPTNWFPFALGGPAQSRPPVLSFPIGPATNGAALLGSQDGQVYAVDSVTGALGWRRPIASVVQAAPAGHFVAYLGTAHDRIIVGSRNSTAPNSLFGLDLDGLVRWYFDNSAAQLGDDRETGIISGSVSLDYDNSRAYFASRRGTTANPSSDTLWCVSFDGSTVQRVWSIDLGDIDGSPVLYNGVVYVGNNAGVVYAVDATTGAVNWPYALGDGPIKGFIFPAGAADLLLSTTSNVWSLHDNGGSGSLNWKVDSGTIPSPSTPVVVPNGTDVLVGSSDGNLYQMAVSGPAPIRSVPLGVATPAVGIPTYDYLNSMIYVGTDEGIIYAVQLPLP